MKQLTTISLIVLSSTPARMLYNGRFGHIGHIYIYQRRM